MAITLLTTCREVVVGENGATRYSGEQVNGWERKDFSLKQKNIPTWGLAHVFWGQRGWASELISLGGGAMGSQIHLPQLFKHPVALLFFCGLIINFLVRRLEG